MLLLSLQIVLGVKKMLTDFDRTKAAVYTVNTRNTPLNLRAMPNTNATILAEMPKGAKVICYGVASDKWLFVDYLRPDNILVSGFAHSDYLKKGETI